MSTVVTLEPKQEPKQLPMRMPVVVRRGRIVPSSRKRVRADALPEFTRYRDDGCEVSVSCLTCPLPRCRYEEPGGLRAVLNEYRDRQILQLRTRGVPVEVLADRFGVSRRTVFRVLETAARKRGRAGSNGPSRAAVIGRIGEREEKYCA